MKYVLLGGLMLIAANSLAQSKKKQIEILQHQLDSVKKVNSVLLETLDEHVTTTRQSLDKLNKENEVLRSIMKGYVYTIDELNTQTMILRAENDSLMDKVKSSEEKKGSKSKNTSSNSENDSLDNPFASGNHEGWVGTGNGIALGNDSGPTEEELNPFAFGGSGEDKNFEGFGSGMGTGGGVSTNSASFGNDSGQRNSSKRVRLNNVSVDNIKINHEATICYRLTVDEKGNVVRYTFDKSKTTTTDQVLINEIGEAIKKQVRYNKSPGSPFVLQFYNIHVKAQ